MIGATSNLEDVAAVARRYPTTRFALISASVHDANFPANVTGITFDDREVGYLAGFLAALERGRVPRVSAVAGQPTPAVRRIVSGFEAGARRPRANVGVRVTYTDTFVDQRACNGPQTHRWTRDRGSCSTLPARAGSAHSRRSASAACGASASTPTSRAGASDPGVVRQAHR